VGSLVEFFIKQFLALKKLGKLQDHIIFVPFKQTLKFNDINFMQFVAHTWSKLSHQTIDQLGCWSHLNSKCALDFPCDMCENFQFFIK
jgi:hypothetical protein